MQEEIVSAYFNDEVYYKNIFRQNVVFGTVPIGDPADATLNLIEHIRRADIIVVENHVEFSRLLTHINQSPLSRNILVKPKAVIYQFDLHSNAEKRDYIIKELLEKAKTKKILVVSDEGSSVFLEPGNWLKSELVNNNMGFQILPGPVSAVQSVLSSTSNFDMFAFGSSLAAIPIKNRKRVFDRVLSYGAPTVFLLTAKDSKNCLESIRDYFGNDWTGDFSINLTMTTERHIRGTFDEIISFIDSNPNIFKFDTEHKKFAILILPNKRENPHEGYEEPLDPEWS